MKFRAAQSIMYTLGYDESGYLWTLEAHHSHHSVALAVSAVVRDYLFVSRVSPEFGLYLHMTSNILLNMYTNLCLMPILFLDRLFLAM